MVSNTVRSNHNCFRDHSTLKHSNLPHTAMAVRLSENRYAALGSDSFVGDGSHLADDSVVAFAFYNVGIQNTELLSAKWPLYEKRETQNTHQGNVLRACWDSSSFHFRVWQHVRKHR